MLALVCSCYYHMGPDSNVDDDLWQRKVTRCRVWLLVALSKRRGGGWQSRGEVGAHGDPAR
jgi:hypothetical protein